MMNVSNMMNVNVTVERRRHDDLLDQEVGLRFVEQADCVQKRAKTADSYANGGFVKGLHGPGSFDEVQGSQVPGGSKPPM